LNPNFALPPALPPLTLLPPNSAKYFFTPISGLGC
jgi:hypothetical protein